MRIIRFQNAFTLIELMIVVVIIGIIASFTIPNYAKSIERAHLKDAVTQLITIHSANQIYRAQNGVFWPPTNGQNLNAINTNLGLGIIANSMTYTCDGNGANFSCSAQRAVPRAADFTVTVTNGAITAPPVTGATNPSYTCASGDCP